MLLVFCLDYLQSHIVVPKGESIAPADFVRLVAYTLGMLLLYSIAYVPVMELALGERKDRKFVHIALGLPEFRLFGAMLVLLLLIGFLALLTGLASYLLLSVLGPLIGMKAAAAWLFVAAFGFLTFCLVRLAFLLVPATVAERRISMEPSWVLTNGNFWRIVLIQAALLLPVLLVATVLIGLIMSPDLAMLQEEFAGRLDTPAYAEALDKFIANHQAVITLVTTLLMPFFIGFSLGACAHAYKLARPRNEMLAIDTAP
jgi:hypothetical protein